MINLRYVTIFGAAISLLNQDGRLRLEATIIFCARSIIWESREFGEIETKREERLLSLFVNF